MGRARWGVATGLVTAMLIAGCGAGTGGSSGGDDPAKATGSFDWKRYSGQTINVMLNEHPWTDGLKEILPDFEKQTGIKVKLQTYAEELYFDKMEQAVRSASPPDVYFLPMDDFAATHYAANLMQPLTPFLDNPAITESGYNLEDIPAGLRAPGMFPAGDPAPQLYELPVSTEAYILFYNKDLVNQYLGGKVPATMDELVAAAKAISDQGQGKVFGSVMRGVRSDGLRDTITGFVLNRVPQTKKIQSPYNIWFDGAWTKPQLTDPAIVQGITDYAKLVSYGPPNKFNLDWGDATNLFAQGKAAFFVDASVFGPGFEDPKTSKITGKVGYAVMPKTSADGTTGVWSWALAMPKAGKNKGAAWTFMQWATDKERTAILGQGTGGATRQSTASDAGYLKALNPEYVKVVKEAMSTARTTAVIRDGWKPGVFVIVDATLAVAHGTEPDKAMADANEKMKKTIQ